MSRRRRGDQPPARRMGRTLRRRAIGAVPATGRTLLRRKRSTPTSSSFPSRYLGELCTRDWLRPVRRACWKTKSSTAADIFPLVRNELIRWGGETMALPLGVDPSAITPSLKPRRQSPCSRPPRPNAISNERSACLFDAETMKPRITEPAFVDALSQTRPRFRRSGRRRGFELRQPSIPVLGYNDRLVAVTASSRNAASAFKLARNGWLCRTRARNSPRVGGSLARHRGDRSHRPASWYEPVARHERASAAKSSSRLR